MCFKYYFDVYASICKGGQFSVVVSTQIHSAVPYGHLVFSFVFVSMFDSPFWIISIM